MAVYWCTDIIPLAVTGLIPFFFLPMSGLLSLKEVCHNYLDVSRALPQRDRHHVPSEISMLYVMFLFVLLRNQQPCWPEA